MANTLFFNNQTIKRFIFTFKKEIETPTYIILQENEKVFKSFKALRDILIITNKRFIIINKQGILGKRYESYSIPFNIIIMYSIKTAYIFDANTEVRLWTAAGKLKLKLNRKANILKIEELLSNIILENKKD